MKRRRRVLFVCVGNSCRSQMAEGFGRAYGSDVLECASAGLAPAILVAAPTRQVMAEKNIPLDDHFPKALTEFDLARFDLVVNMSGCTLPLAAAEWVVRDPIGESQEVYRQVRDRIENLVMALILETRRQFDTRRHPAAK